MIIRTNNKSYTASIFFCSLCIIYSIIWFYFSLQFSFVGDEFYTYDIDKVQRPIPYNLTISLIKPFVLLDQMGILILRSTNLLFLFLSFYIWIFYILRNKKEYLFFSGLIVTSTFLFQEATYLRYYIYYFLTSTLTLLILINLIDYKVNKKILFGATLSALSPFFLFVVNSVQYFFYCVIIFLYEKSLRKSYKVILFTLLLLAFIFICLNPQHVWNLYGILNLNNQFFFDYSGSLKGLTLATLIKPFYAVYQFTFGYILLPTEYMFLPLLMLVIFISILYILLGIYKKDYKFFINIIFPSTLALFFTFYFFETFSYPGATLLYAKHVIFFYPIFLFIFACSSRFISSKRSNVIFIIILIAQIIGISSLLTVKPDIWQAIDEEISSLESNSVLVITEKNSEEILNSRGFTDIPKINYKSELPKILPKKIIILVRDYKLYTKLSLEQNWNQGINTTNNVNKLNNILLEVQDKYDIQKSIVAYPIFYYEFKLNPSSGKFKPSSFWGHNMKDLRLPIKVRDKNVISSFVIDSNDYFIHPPQDEIYLNIIDKKPHFSGDIRCGDVVINLVENKNIWNLFSSYFGNDIPLELTAFSWTHKPLASFSITYEGSWFKHKASVTKINTSSCNENSIKISNNSDNKLRVWNLEN